MYKYLFTILLSCIGKADCQPIVTDVSNKRIMEWDSSYQVTWKHFRADSNFEISYYYSVKKNNKLFAEYFRHSDTSFLFVKYDTLNGSRLQRGLITICNEIFDSATVQIPDYFLDPDGSKGLFKGTILYDNSYRKNGIWWEKDSLKMIWKGEYKNGLREGKWQEGIQVCCNETSEIINDFQFDLLRPYLIHNFIKGIDEHFYKDSTFWPKIKGNWYYHHDLKPNRLVFERIKESKDLVFINREKTYLNKVIARKLGFAVDEKLSINWKQIEDIVEFTIKEKSVRFRVLRLDDFRLILQPAN